MDILGFNQYYKYPKSDQPLLWACGRAYYYKGEKIASAKGGDIYAKPEIEVIRVCSFEPMNISTLIEENREYLETIENEAKDFINQTYKNYGDHYRIGVAFSGGKDSQAIFDLVSQVIPPSKYFTIFSDTKMELPETYKCIENTKERYRKEYNDFNFITATAPNDIEKNWEFFGQPSRIHRWCCTVCKTVPYTKLLLKELGNEQDIVVFEGVRHSESSNRSNYDRIAKGVKQKQITNARPIIHWNDTEVYLYLLYKGIKINSAYRSGLTRVGCAVCPFASNWSEYLINKMHPEVTKPFLDIITKSLIDRNIVDEKKINDYITSGNWKKRGGDEALSPFMSDIDIVHKDDIMTIKVTNPSSDFDQWMNILPITNEKIIESHIEYEVNFKDVFLYFTKETLADKLIFKYKMINQRDEFASLLTKLLYKVTYCVMCEACIVECPTNAIQMGEKVMIDKNKCIHCYNCLSVCDKGCLVAKSRNKRDSGGRVKKNNEGIDRYSTFGFREPWLNLYMDEGSNWENALGNKQVVAFRHWVQEANLLKDDSDTSLYTLFKNNSNKNMLWEIIYINLCHNSQVFSWFSNLSFNKEIVKNDLLDNLCDNYTNNNRNTLNNPLSALFNTFKENQSMVDTTKTILKLKGRSYISLERQNNDNISTGALLYALYKFSEKRGYYDLSLKEIFRDDLQLTPYKLFGISKDRTKEVLISLQDNEFNVVKVNFSANLDSIYLNSEHTSLEVLKILLGGE
ncbi:MAG: phosphoadenosine phosphosulfate reductase family protein [Candidatus Cloacimonetes bacterium]|nr:phosphoadenosine phosphosulfate reductase family protein [Candidatus Cloacimonadota bacterium]